MALTHQGMKALEKYLLACEASGRPEKRTIQAAVVLTDIQRIAVSTLLCVYWGRQDYPCPAELPIRPRHGYDSRVLKDKFPCAQYLEWLRIGCSDEAVVESDASGRPRLTIAGQADYAGYIYTVTVPIRSDSHGDVHIDGVVPEGLPKGAQKKAALSVIP